MAPPITNRPLPPPPRPKILPKAVQAVKKGVKDAVGRAKTNIEKKPLAQIKGAKDSFTAVKDGIQGVKDQRAAIRAPGGSFSKTWKDNFSKASNPQIKLDKGSLAKQGGKVFGLYSNAKKLPGQINTAVQDARQGFRQGATAEQRDKAIGSVATASKTALNTAKTSAELFRDGAKVGSTYRQASKGFKSAIQDAGLKTTKSVQRKAALSATRAALTEGVRTRDVKTAVQKSVTALGDGTKKGVKNVITDGANRATTKAANKALTSAATKAAEKAVAKTVAKTAAKAAGRFVPGANVAIAAADTANAYATLKDKNASTTKKVTSVITAVGSVAAATNIPVVSQVGAAVSTVSSFVGGLFG